MKPHRFQIRIEGEEKTGRLVAAYFQIREGIAAETREFADGNIFADYSARGELIGIEMLGPCKPSTINRIAPQEPQVREFIRKKMPQELVLA